MAHPGARRDTVPVELPRQHHRLRSAPDSLRSSQEFVYGSMWSIPWGESRRSARTNLRGVSARLLAAYPGFRFMVSGATMQGCSRRSFGCRRDLVDRRCGLSWTGCASRERLCDVTGRSHPSRGLDGHSRRLLRVVGDTSKGEPFGQCDLSRFAPGQRHGPVHQISHKLLTVAELLVSSQVLQPIRH